MNALFVHEQPTPREEDAIAVAAREWIVWLLRRDKQVLPLQHEYNDLVKQMMEIVESGTAFSSYTYGLVYSSTEKQYILVPPDLGGIHHRCGLYLRRSSLEY